MAEATPLMKEGAPPVYGTSAEASLAEIVAALQAKVAALERRHEAAASGAVQDVTSAETAAHDGWYDTEQIQNCFSFAVSHVLRSDDDGHPLPSLGKRLYTALVLISLCLVQLTFAFAFMDTASLGWWTNYYAATAPPIHVANYYSTRSYGVVYGDIMLPTINVIVSALSILCATN